MKTNEENKKLNLPFLWRRVPIIIRAVILGLIVSTLGVISWSLIGMTIPMPWSVFLMTALLYVYWQFFNGKIGPSHSKNSRKTLFRKKSLSRSTWILSLLAAGLIVLFEQSGLIITFRLIEFPAERFLSEYSFIEEAPVWAGWLAIIMISVVAGICEETGFRGYMQVPLEKKYSPWISIAIVSIVFVLVHLHQAWSGPIIIHIFLISILFGTLAYYSGSLIPGIIAHVIMDVFNFSFWWTDLGGQFDKPLIQNHGIDFHFGFWSVVFISSNLAFILIIRKMRLSED